MHNFLGIANLFVGSIAFGLGLYAMKPFGIIAGSISILIGIVLITMWSKN